MWPEEYIELKNIEDLLVCGICYEVMDTSVITSCSHNYCSLCIRKYLHYKTQCPACFTETFEKDLRKNKVIDDIITEFSKVKDKLQKFLQVQIQFAQINKDEDVCKTPKSVHRIKNSHINKQENKIITNILIPENNASPSTNAQTDISSPSTSGRPKIPLIFTPKSSKRSTISNMRDTKAVICPVCKVAVSELHINRHLDDCLKRESQKDRLQVGEAVSKRKPLPKLVFSLMKDAVIRKKLKEFGLSSQGDRKALEARLQRYIILYNAECDKSYPRAVSELIKQCEEEENIEKKINKSSLLNKLQVTRNTEENIIENERKKYLQVNKDSFDTLVRKIKNTDFSKKVSVRRSLLKECTEGSEDIPHKYQAVPENLDNMVTEQDDLKPLNTDVYIPDSDSDTSCPLQMYSSTDPKKSLNVALSFSNVTDSQSTSECETSNEELIDQEKLETDYFSPKVDITEKEDNSHAFSDTPICKDEATPVMESYFYKDKPKNISKCSSNTSKCKMLLRKKEELILTNKSEQEDSRIIKDSDSNDVLKEQEIEVEKSCVLQDILCDFTSNDSTDTKFNYGKFRPTNHGTLSCSVIKSPQLEKENISCSPESSGNRVLRKRSRDTLQTDKVITSSIKKKIKKTNYTPSNEIKESSEESVLCIQNVGGEQCSSSKSRSRKRLTHIAEETTSLRKSARTQSKDNHM